MWPGGGERRIGNQPGQKSKNCGTQYIDDPLRLTRVLVRGVYSDCDRSK